ncbi:MAG TPA: M20/M25/M40 family metallo-hydrolase [Nitrospiria bacterium]|nr:M20/M25/M40 family metallo-hydrolase [Nitrospiria bacterium]
MPIVRQRRFHKRDNLEEIIQQRVAQVTEAGLTEHLKRIVGVRHHRSAPGALEAAGDYITEQFRAAGLSIHPHVFQAFGHQNRNIVASFHDRAGDRAHRPLLILAAHYDTVAESPGADDNASGVAVMLEAARRLADLDRPGRWVFIGFAQEEQHCLGSTLYAIKARRSGLHIQGMIALECVGYASHKPASQQPLRELPAAMPDVGNFLGIVCNPEASAVKQRFEKVVGCFVSDLPLVSLIVPNAGHGFPDTRRSDHAPFWDSGYPALMLTDTANFRNPWYHRPGDRLETLDLPFMTKVTKAIVAFLAEAALKEE